MAVRRHPILLGRDVLEVVVGLYVVLWLRAHLSAVGTLRTLLGLAIVVLIVRAAWHVARWNADRFVVTGSRVLLVTGLLNRRVSMLPLRKVTDMSYQRSSLGWMFGYGEFVMESAGEAQELRRVRFLPHPDQLYIQLSELLFPGGEVFAVDDY